MVTLNSNNLILPLFTQLFVILMCLFLSQMIYMVFYQNQTHSLDIRRSLALFVGNSETPLRLKS